MKPLFKNPKAVILAERTLEQVKSYDVYSLVFMTVCTLLAIVFYTYVPNASSVIMLDIFIAIAIGTMILIQALADIPFFAMLRRFYIVPLVYLMYDQVHRVVTVVHPVDYDDLLIEADRWIFGTDPTVWLSQFSHPVLTEYLQTCYFLFYILPIMQAIELWRRRDLDRLDVFARAMAFCYFASYLAYFAMPAIGPRFTLHEFSALNTELPGLWFTNWFRQIIDVGGGIAQGSINPAADVNRDCMPSGHTMLTLVNIILGFRNGSRYRWLFFVIGGSLIISTVYLRYHYVIDVLVGIVMAFLFLWLEPKADRHLLRRTARLLSVWKKSVNDL